MRILFPTLVCLLLFFSLLSPLQAQGESKQVKRNREGLNVSMVSSWAAPQTAGWPVPVHIHLDNQGDRRRVECRIIMSGDYYYNTANQWWESKRTLILQPKEKASFTLLAPWPSTDGRIQIRMDGKYEPFLSAPLTLTNQLHSSGHSPYHSPPPRTSKSSKFRYPYPLFIGKNPIPNDVPRMKPEHLGDAWQAYAGPAAIWVRTPDWDAIPLSARKAILKAVFSGQSLFLYDWNLPEAPTPETIAKKALAGMDPSQISWEERKKSRFPCIQMGRGTISAQGGTFDFKKTLPVPAPSSFPYTSYPTIPGVEEPPSGAFLTIVILFSILIGPVNLIYVLTKKKRMLFLVTTPVIAIASAMILLSFSMIREGFQTQGATWSYTRFHPETKQAVVMARQMVYSALSTGNWTFQSDTLLVPVKVENSRSHYSYRSRNNSELPRLTIDWSAGQTAQAGWIPARVPRRFTTLQVIPFRGRLTLENGSKGLIVRNGLGTDILRGLFLHDGIWHRLENLPNGGELTATPSQPFKDLSKTLQLYPLSMKTRNKTTLSDGEFLVVTQSNPLIDRGGKNISEHADLSLHVFRGVLSEIQ